MRVAKWLTVCDEGGERCDNTTLHRCRITVDGKARVATLCDKHVAPWAKLRDKGKTVPAKGRVYSDPSEAKKAR